MYLESPIEAQRFEKIYKFERPAPLDWKSGQLRKREPVRPSFTAEDSRSMKTLGTLVKDCSLDRSATDPRHRKRSAREKFSAPGERHYVSRPFGAKYKDSI